MSITRLVSETDSILQKITKRYIFPIDSDGASRLSMLMLTAAINQRYRLGVNSLSRKVRSIRILGNLEKDAADIFKATIDNRNIPAVCHLKNVADETLSLKEAKVRK